MFSFVALLFFFLGSINDTKAQHKILFEDFEGDDNWEIFSDSIIGGNSYYLQSRDTVSMIVFDEERASNVAHFEYFLDTGSVYIFSSAHVAVPNTEAGLNFEHSYGIELMHKGDAFDLLCECPGIGYIFSTYITVPASEEWTMFRANWDDAHNAEWGGELAPGNIDSIGVCSYNPKQSRDTGSFSIDNISIWYPGADTLEAKIAEAEEYLDTLFSGVLVSPDGASDNFTSVIEQANSVLQSFGSDSSDYSNALYMLENSMYDYKNTFSGTDAEAVFDFENKDISKWYPISDSASGGESKLISLEVSGVVNGEGTSNESSQCMSMEFKLSNPALFDPGFAGCQNSNLDYSEIELLRNTQGISVLHKGYASWFGLMTSDVKDGGNYGYFMPHSDDWQKHVILWSELEQPGWAVKVDLDLDSISGIQFICKGVDVTNATMMIDEIKTFNLEYEASSISNDRTIEFRVMPQPAQDVLIIEPEVSSKYMVEVVSIAAESLIKFEATGFTEINIANLPVGMYVLKLYTENGSGSRLFIKE